MIDSLLNIVDRSIELVNLKQKNNKEYFELVVQPLFEEFEKVVEAYFNLFQAQDIRSDEAEVIRNGYIQSRVKVTELAKVYKKKSNDEELKEFFEAVSRFFHGGIVIPSPDTRSDGRLYIDIINNKEKLFRFSSDSPDPQKKMLEKLNTNWAEVVRLYSALKMKYGLPIGFKA